MISTLAARLLILEKGAILGELEIPYHATPLINFAFIIMFLKGHSIINLPRQRASRIMVCAIRARALRCSASAKFMRGAQFGKSLA